METLVPIKTEQVLDALCEMLMVSESDAVRISAAKILLERLSPKKTDEEQKHEADERDHALAEARGLLAELASTKRECFRLKNEVDKSGAT